MVPWGGFIIGVVLSNLWQWLAWLQKNPGKPRIDYWRMTTVYALSNIIVDGLICMAWTAGWLDVFVGLLAKWTPGAAEWANVGIPLTPQVGVMVGFSSDLFGDQAAFIVKRILASKFPALVPSETKP